MKRLNSNRHLVTKCDHCDKPFRSDTLGRHENNCKANPNLQSCNSCKKRFATPIELDAHKEECATTI